MEGQKGSPRGKGSPGPSHDAATKVSITCSNMPESLFDATVAKRHFGKFGRVTKILLRPKKQTCVIDYDSHVAAQKALLNAGAYDGYMFDVTWTKRKKKRTRKEGSQDDPDWVPDSDVEEELSAMSEVPVYRPPRQKPMHQDNPPSQTRKAHSSRAMAARDRSAPLNTILQQTASDPPAVVSIPTTMSTAEAAAELRQLRQRVSRTPDEQRRTLDARDRVLRAWGGTGARVREGGATIGTCPDMCPEKERLQRQAEHQVMLLECEADTDGGAMAERRAVKQYSRSSADQETPMCYELRPPATLARTMAYLLREVADCPLQVSLADWFHFMWDRCRGIRKDITQQALCCEESVRLVEQCARFHAHCAARLADLEHTQFDQRLNTDNLTKCLQSLKHMYADLGAESKPREAEFRSYVALLNLGDANFCWEIKQLPQEIQKSAAITFTVEIFMALDNNNFVRFFRLVRNKATYLQACILLRYFNDVRARALARIVKAFAPRGGSKYPVKDLMENLAFEDLDSLKSFISHYGLKLSRHDDELSVILDRNQFIEDSDPYPVSRAIDLIESKRNCSVGEIIAGGSIPESASYINHNIHSSFNSNGTLKSSSLLAEDQGYATVNESNKNLSVLRNELEKNPQVDVSYRHVPTAFQASEPKNTILAKSEFKGPLSAKLKFTKEVKDSSTTQKTFSFKPAIPVVSPEVIKSSPEKLFTQDTIATFSFSKPEDNKTTSLWDASKSTDGFQSAKGKAIFAKSNVAKSVFGNQSENLPCDNLEGRVNLKQATESNIFTQSHPPNTLFGGIETKASNVFSSPTNQTIFSTEKPVLEETKSNIFKNVFTNANESTKPFFKTNEMPQNVFGSVVNSTGIFNQTEYSAGMGNSDKVKTNIFATRPSQNEQITDTSGPSIFGQEQTQKSQTSSNIFKPQNTSLQSVFGQNNQSSNLFTQGKTVVSKSDPKSVFGGSVSNKTSEVLPIPEFKTPSSPKSLFSGSIIKNQDVMKAPFSSTIFGENKVLNAAFGPLVQQPNVVYPSVSVGEEHSLEQKRQEDLRRKEIEVEEIRRVEEAKKIDQQIKLEQRKNEEIRREELRRQEELRKLQEEKLKQDELRRRLQEEKRQADLIRIAEEKRKVEDEKRKAEERKRLLNQIDKESQELVDDLTIDINLETVKELLSEEMQEMLKLMEFAEVVTDEIIENVTNGICIAELKAEKYLSEKLMAKYSDIWKAYTARNIKRRMMVQETPIWLADRSPLQAANSLERQVLPAVLAQMNAFHSGYRFTGETKPELSLQPYNIIEIVRTSFLKGLSRIKVQYNECFFWKITVSSPGPNHWLNKQVDIHNWLLSKFSDKDSSGDHDDNVIYLKKTSWNNLMHFAISVAMNKYENEKNNVEGSNAMIFYETEDDSDLILQISEQLQNKCNKQVFPLAVVTSNNDTSDIDKFLNELVNVHLIAMYRIFIVDRGNTLESLNKCTKSALKWLARNVPNPPPIETDSLKSVLLQCVGTELWLRLKLQRQTGMNSIYKDLHKLIVLYNVALDKLADVITDKSIFSYPSFPTEFKQFLPNDTTLPKSYEFFPNNWMNIENIHTTRDLIRLIRLPHPESLIYPQDYMDLQTQIHDFCKNINWFDNPTEIAYKIIAHLPQEFSNPDLSTAEFIQYFEYYDFLDVLNLIITEKINTTSEFYDKTVIYEKSALRNYRNGHWLHEVELVSAVKHKAIDYTVDEIDNALNVTFSNSAKRMRYDECDDLLALEDKDETLVEETICKYDVEIDNFNAYNNTVSKIEKQLEEESVKASNLEELLRSALHD